jgi:hypothetical protein
VHQAPRPTTGREVAYQFAILACVCLMILLTVATALAWAWPGADDSPLRTIAFFTGPPNIVFLGLILYGYVSEHRSERTRGLPDRREPNA